MNVYDQVKNLADSLGPSLMAFLPELVICATIVLILLARIVPVGRGPHAFWLMFGGSLVALYFAAPLHYLGKNVVLPTGLKHWSEFFPGIVGPTTWTPDRTSPREIFTGMLVCDHFAIYMRGLLLLFAVLYTLFTRLSGVPSRDDANDFYVLILGATLGMCLMVSANHVLMIFLGIEMASVPSYVLAGFQRQRRKGSEAALKFAIFGAATAGVMLYGLSLLVGALGSAHLPTMASQLATVLWSGAGSDHITVLVLGGLMVSIGLAFKLSAVPFHFWAPDVFEGAAAEIGAFLSVASKAAALGLLARLAVMFSGGWEHEPARFFVLGLVMLLAAVTCTFGNLAAYGQTNVKRLLAYSTIAHAGYMMMPVAAAVQLMGTNHADPTAAVAAMALYVAIYLFMNLGAFAVVAFLRNRLGSEEIADYAGLVRRSPGLAVCFAIILFSLVGLPPLAGFSAKFAIFSYVYDAKLLALLFIGVLNTVLSLFYYLRIVRVMMFDLEPADRPAPTIPLLSGPGLYCLAVTLPLLGLFIWWDGLFALARTAAASLLQ